MPAIHSVTVSSERLTTALHELDAGARALLDLSLRRGVLDEEIAQLLHTAPGEIASRREATIGRIAAELAMDDEPGWEAVRAAIVDLPLPQWQAPAPVAEPQKRGRRFGRRQQPVESADRTETRAAADVSEREAPASLAADPAPETEANTSEREDEREEQPEAESPTTPVAAERGRVNKARRRRVAGTALAAVALLVAIVIIASGGERSDAPRGGDAAPAGGTRSDRPGGGESAQAGDGKAEQAGAGGAKLETLLPGAEGSAGATLVGAGPQARLKLSVAGLRPPAGRYEVWLFNSVADAVSIGNFKKTPATVDLRLPANASGYRLLDVSLEPSDGQSPHSGRSVLRVPMTRVFATRR